eukprot:gene16910-17854_t
MQPSSTSKVAVRKDSGDADADADGAESDVPTESPRAEASSPPSKLATIRRKADRSAADAQFHFLKGAITRAEAEGLLKDGTVGAFLVRDKVGSDSRVISVVTKSSPLKILHEILTTSSSAEKEVLLRNQPIGSPPATTLHAACLEMSRDATILGIALMGVEDENVYGRAVYAKSSSAVYGQAVYIDRGSGSGGGGGGSNKNNRGTGTGGRCDKCRSLRKFCMCNVTADERHRARTLSSARGKVDTIVSNRSFNSTYAAPKMIGESSLSPGHDYANASKGARPDMPQDEYAALEAGKSTYASSATGPAFNKRSIVRFNSEEDDAHDYVNTSNTAATMA